MSRKILSIMEDVPIRSQRKGAMARRAAGAGQGARRWPGSPPSGARIMRPVAPDRPQPHYIQQYIKRARPASGRGRPAAARALFRRREGCSARRGGGTGRAWRRYRGSTSTLRRGPARSTATRAARAISPSIRPAEEDRARRAVPAFDHFASARFDCADPCRRRRHTRRPRRRRGAVARRHLRAEDRRCPGGEAAGVEPGHAHLIDSLRQSRLSRLARMRSRRGRRRRAGSVERPADRLRGKGLYSRNGL